MITFKQFILESAGSEIYSPSKIDIDAAVEWLTTKAPKVLAAMKRTDVTYYRGASYLNGIGLIDSRKFNRMSANTANFYTVWIDNSPEWKHFPKRSKGLICSTSHSTARGYGATFTVIPSDDSIVGNCGASDFWHSFPKITDVGFYDLDNLASWTHRILKAISENPEEEYGFAEQIKAKLEGFTRAVGGGDYEDLVWLLQAATKEKIESAASRSGVNIKHMPTGLLTVSSLYEVYKTGLNPADAKVTAALAPQSFSDADIDEEVWIMGECFTIDSTTLVQLRQDPHPKAKKLYNLITHSLDAGSTDID